MAEPNQRRILGLPLWLALSVLTIVLWGAWGLQSKLAVDRVSPWMNQVLFPLGLAPIAFGLVVSGQAKASPQWKSGAFYSFITGILGGAGNVTFYLAMVQGGKVSIVVPLTSLFPLVTVLLARVVLRETISKAQWMGLGLSVVAIVLLGM